MCRVALVDQTKARMTPPPHSFAATRAISFAGCSWWRWGSSWARATGQSTSTDSRAEATSAGCLSRELLLEHA